MKVLIIGSGGRESALAWRIGLETGDHNIFVAPGNGGTAEKFNNVSLSPLDFDGIFDFVRENNIGMIVVGPEEPLVRGIADTFLRHPDLQHVHFVGPVAAGAMLEGSKDFAKAFMQRNGIPTARYKSFTKTDIQAAKEFLRTLNSPYVIKADGLAAGKGVVILNELSEAEAHIDKVFQTSAFGKAGDILVIEEFLTGIEVSVFVATDGKSYVVLPEAKDYKRIGIGDTGLNTGGMGAVSPVIFADAAFMQKVKERIIIPSVNGLMQEKIPFKGFLFIGLMNCGGEPYVIEYNVRLGDPETEAILPRIVGNFTMLLQYISEERLDQYDIQINPAFAVSVVIASGGYPGDYCKGLPILINESASTHIFHAGTELKENQLLTSGGRVLVITAVNESLEAAQYEALNTAKAVEFEAKYYRKDIGNDLINYNG